MSQQPIFSVPVARGAVPERQSLRRYLATSEHWFAVLARSVYRGGRRFSVPAPRIVGLPIRWLVLGAVVGWNIFWRLFVCEPILKSYFKECGRNFRGDCHLPWIAGKGDIIVGDNVQIDGAFSVAFAARYSDHPTLIIGAGTGIGYNCQFHIGKRITIGQDCNISGNCWIADSNAHPSDPAERLARRPPAADEVRPVTIGDGVWIGRCSLIFPGVRIGSGSVISAGSVVRTHIPPYSVAAGNPAQVVFRMKRPETQAPSGDGGPGPRPDATGVS